MTPVVDGVDESSILRLFGLGEDIDEQMKIYQVAI